MRASLVSCEELLILINNKEESILIVDCNYAPGTDYVSKYKSMHIPGAVHFDVEKASYKTPTVIREIYTPDKFQEYVQTLGVKNSSKIILYDHSVETCGFFGAARAFWLFKLYGKDNVSILDGGFQQWQSLKYPVTVVCSTPEIGDFVATWNPKHLATYDEFKNSVDNHIATILDSRPTKQFKGEEKVAALKDMKGTFIPSTINLPIVSFVQNGVAKSKEEIEKMLKENGITNQKPIITFCNSGMQSCSVAFFCSLSGFDNVKNFNGALPQIVQLAPELISGKIE